MLASALNLPIYQWYVGVRQEVILIYPFLLIQFIERPQNDVQNALTEYENSVKVNTVKTTKRKKKNEA